MSEVNLKTERFDICRTVAMKFGRTVVDDTLIVPDIKPDIKKILDVSARSYITDITPGQDKIHIEGTAKATVLYLPDGDVIGNTKALIMSREFSYTIDAKGTTADDQVTAESEIGSVDSTLINSRKVNIRLGINIGAKICRCEPLELPAGTDEIVIECEPKPPAMDLIPFTPRQSDNESTPTNTCSKIELKKVPIRLADKQFISDGSMILREQHEISSKLPQIGEILNATATVEPEEMVTSSGNTRLKGIVKVNVLYEDAADTSSDSNKKSLLRNAEFTIPYNEQFDTPNSMDDMECDAEYTVREIYTEIRDNLDGEPRMIGAEVVVGVSISGYMISEPQAVTDAYSTDGSTLTLEFSETAPEQLIDTKTAQISHKFTAKRKATDAEILGVCGVTIEKTSVDDLKIKDNTVYIKGTINAKVLCSSNDENQPLYAIDCKTEFEHSFDCDQELGNKVACDAKIFINHLGYTISGSDSVDLRMIIGISIKLVKNDRIKTVTAIDREESEDTEQRGMQCYIIYFVQSGDTLWNIAKRYHTTVDELVKNNNIADRDKINVGQKIKIMSLT